MMPLEKQVKPSMGDLCKQYPEIGVFLPRWIGNYTGDPNIHESDRRICITMLGGHQLIMHKYKRRIFGMRDTWGQAWAWNGKAFISMTRP